VKAGTKNPEAYQLYLKGQDLLYRRGGGVLQAAKYFDQAVKLYPVYAQAWDSYTVIGYLGFAHPQTCMPQSMEAARRAVALDASLAEAHTTLAMASLVGAGTQWRRNESFFPRSS
jgi:Tfp pilus assembly protein PilF